MLMSAGVELPKGWAIGGWLLVGGEKMSKSTGNVVRPLDLVDTVGIDGFRYYVLADTPYGQDGDFSYEGLIGRYNADLANNLGNLASRVATVVASKCDGKGPAPVARQPAGRGRRGGRRRRDRRLGRRGAEPRPRGDVAPHPGDERLPRGPRAVEAGSRVRGRRGARRRLGGAAHRHDPRLAGVAPHGPGDLGAHRPRRPGHRPAGAHRRGVGRLPRPVPSSPRAPRSSPASRRDVASPPHVLGRQPLPSAGGSGRGGGGRGRGSGARRHDDGDRGV